MASGMSGAELELYEVSARPVQKKKVQSQKRLVRIRPKTAEELAKIFVNTTKFPSPIRPVGSGSSTTRCSDTPTGTLVDMKGLKRILAMDKDTVTVQAGITLRDLAEQLASEDMELVGGCLDPDRTVGGAVSSGSLGARLLGDGAQLASTVTHLTLINGEGRRVEVGENMGDLLSLIRMSYGLLGVVYSVKLRIRPIRMYSISNNKTDFDEFVALIPNLMEAQAAVRASLFPFRDRAHIELRFPNDDGRQVKVLPWKLRNWATQAALPKMVQSVGKAIPIKKLRDPIIDSMTEVTHSLGSMAESGSNAMEQTGSFTRSMLLEHPVSCTWFFPEDKLKDMLPAFRQFCIAYYRQNGFRCDLPAEVWRVNQDQASLLSPSYDSAGIALKMVSTGNAKWDNYLLEFAEFAARFNGIPLFNLTKGFKPGYASRVYGKRLQRFSAMRQRLDANDRLRNQYFREHIQ